MSIEISRQTVYDATAREGRQCAYGNLFSHEFCLDLASSLSELGIRYQELGSPAAHPLLKESITQVADSLSDVQRWVHIRCHPNDLISVPENVDAVGIYFGTSPEQQQHSHRKTISHIVKAAQGMIGELTDMGYIVRFTAEDATRTQYKTLLGVYRELERTTDVNIFGIADTVGLATPEQIGSVVRHLNEELTTPLQFHGHNDRGFADVNAYEALVAGAQSVQVTVGGIGERNGITSTNSMLLNLLHLNPEQARRLYDISKIEEMELSVMDELQIPPNYRFPISSHVNTDMAGVHQRGAHAYHFIDLSRDGYPRTSPVNHPLTGSNNVSSFCKRMGIEINPLFVRKLTSEIKEFTYRQTRNDPIRTETDVRSFIDDWISKKQEALA
jgi:homocitrate synthase